MKQFSTEFKAVYNAPTESAALTELDSIKNGVEKILYLASEIVVKKGCQTIPLLFQRQLDYCKGTPILFQRSGVERAHEKVDYYHAKV